MTWSDFRDAALGVAVLGVALALIVTLVKTWPILQNTEELSQDVRDTGHLALRGPARGILRLLNLIFPKGGDRNAQKRKE